MLKLAMRSCGVVLGCGSAAFAVKKASTRSLAVAVPDRRETPFCGKKPVVVTDVARATPSAYDWQAVNDNWHGVWCFGMPGSGRRANMAVPGFHSLRGADVSSFNDSLATPTTKNFPALTDAATAANGAGSNDDDTKGAAQDQEQDQLQLVTIAQPAAVESIILTASVLDLARFKVAQDFLGRAHTIANGGYSLSLLTCAINCHGYDKVTIVGLRSRSALSFKHTRSLLAIEAARSAPASAAGSLSLFNSEPAPFKAVNFGDSSKTLFGASGFSGLTFAPFIGGYGFSTKALKLQLELAAAGGYGLTLINTASPISIRGLDNATASKQLHASRKPAMKTAAGAAALGMRPRTLSSRLSYSFIGSGGGGSSLAKRSKRELAAAGGYGSAPGQLKRLILGGRAFTCLAAGKAQGAGAGCIVAVSSKKAAAVAGDASPRRMVAIAAAASASASRPLNPTAPLAALRAISVVPKQPASAAKLNTSFKQGDQGYVVACIRHFTQLASSMRDQQHKCSFKGMQRACRGDISKATGVCCRPVLC